APRPDGSPLADLLGPLLQPAEVLAGPGVRDQPVRSREPPGGEPHGDAAVHAAELAAAVRTGPGGAGPHGLDLLQPPIAPPARVLVDGHVHRVSTAQSTATGCFSP